MQREGSVERYEKREVLPVKGFRKKNINRNSVEMLAAMLTAAMVLHTMTVWAVLETEHGGSRGGFGQWELATGSNAEGNLATRSNAKENLATPASLFRIAEGGDLWEGWVGDTDFSGDGTASHPYQIGSVKQLMGLSQAVAEGADYADTYFELVQDLDLSGIESRFGNWNPIGWYQREAELSGQVAHPFRGHFDGGGNRISGLKISDPGKNLKNLGLFGVIDGGSVHDLVLEAETLSGTENVAVLAGTMEGDSRIYNVEVTGNLRSEGDAGGIAAQVTGRGTGTDGGDQVVIENCRADGVVIHSTGAESYVGGIAGNVQRACLIDNVVITQNGDSNRIQGKGYVGGIAGRMRETGIYNSYVNGTIGGNGSKAAGGIVGKYESGNLILARMAGEISRTNNGSASREGTFVGTRDARHNFTYGTERDSRMAYLFTNAADKAKRVIGSGIDGDNDFTKEAHIGFWTDLERKYKIVAGRTETDCGDRYFYEELEDGVRYLITQKLGREFTPDGYGEGLGFRPDHFAPGYMGEPVRGYLVYIPRIDARNANGTYDTDVAVLTAVSETGSSYYREMDQGYAAAVTPGAVITVTTAPKNTVGNRYQLAADRMEAGRVKPPVYRTEDGSDAPMQYVNGGAYTFRMPECDTVLRAEYVKVTSSLMVDPAEMRIHVVMTRNGDRKQPSVLTEVKNDAGILIARYIDGEQDQSVEIQPLRIHAEHNGSGQTADRTVRWLVDDMDLLVNRSEPGYTESDGFILPNLNSEFIQGIVNRELQTQADGQYREPIRNTIYTRYGVMTAAANPQTSADYQPVYANCRITVQFQIVDNTTVRVEGMTLNRPELSFKVTRHLTGNARNPVETITCSEPVVLSAAFVPPRPFLKGVVWKDVQGGKILALKVSGTDQRDCETAVRYDPEGKENPAWIQNIINEDRRKKAENPREKVSGSGSMTETITAVSEDQTHGRVSAECQVSIEFVTVDDTVYRMGGSGSGGGSSGSVGGSSSGSAASSFGSAGGSAVIAGGPGAGGALSGTGGVMGTWTQHEDGRWKFSDQSRRYADEWAAVYNPYANPQAGQNSVDWFRFDTDGFLVTGWFTDADGNRYYLHSVSDGTLGRMYTGWNQIDGISYYFQEESNGTRGALKP